MSFCLSGLQLNLTEYIFDNPVDYEYTNEIDFFRSVIFNVFFNPVLIDDRLKFSIKYNLDFYGLF